MHHGETEVWSCELLFFMDLICIGRVIRCIWLLSVLYVDRELDNVGYYSVMLFVEQMGLVV